MERIHRKTYVQARVLTWIVGFIAGVGWLWAISLAHIELTIDIGGPYECGGPGSGPATFDRATELKYPDECERQANAEIRRAVGVMVFAAPLSAVWAYGAARLPRLRETAENEREHDGEVVSATVETLRDQ